MTEWMPRRPGDDWEEISGVVVPPIPVGTLVAWKSNQLDASVLATVKGYDREYGAGRVCYEIRASAGQGHEGTLFNVNGATFKAIRSELTVIERTPEGIERFLDD